MTIIKALTVNSIKYADRLAVSGNDGDLTYSELYQLICKFASYLKQQGLQSGDTVVIQGMQNTAYIVILLGTLLSGGVVVPVDKNITKNNLDEIIIETNSKYLFTIKEMPEFTLSYIKQILQNIPLETHEIPSANNVCDILYTTGTTGKPEGIIHTNKSHYATVENVLGRLEMPEHNITMITAPLNHSFALRRFYANIVNGSSIVILDNIMYMEKFFSMLDTYCVKSIVMNPSAISLILHLCRDRLTQYAEQIVYIEFTGSVLHIDTVKEIMDVLPKTKLYNMYGSTEAGIMLGFDYTAHLDKEGSIGTPNINSDIYILDKDMNVISGYGKDNAGFLAIKSPIIMKGYLNNDLGTQKVIKDGYYITKDIVYRDIEGYYYFIGRESDVITIGGLKIAPEEIENVMRKYPGITDCACVGKNDNIAGQVPVLFITVNEEYNGAEIYKFIKDKLEPYKCPKDIRIIEEIPKTFNGKILRRKLREML